MGQAKRRGTYEERKAAAIQRDKIRDKDLKKPNSESDVIIVGASGFNEYGSAIAMALAGKDIPYILR